MKLAVQQGVNFLGGSGNKFGQDLLKFDSNSFMNHIIIPKAVDRL